MVVSNVYVFLNLHESTVKKILHYDGDNEGEEEENDDDMDLISLLMGNRIYHNTRGRS